MYDLGRYKNERVYVMGDTQDRHLVEFCLTKTFPMFKRVYMEPIDNVTDAASIIQNKLPQDARIAFENPSFDVFNCTFFTTQQDIHDIL